MGIASALIAVSGFAWWSLFGGARFEQTPRKTEQGIARLRTPDAHSLLIDPNNNEHVFFGSHGGIMESADGGYSWYNGTLPESDAMILSSTTDDPSMMYVAGHDVFKKSADSGKTWQTIDAGLPSFDIHAFVQDPFNALNQLAFIVGLGVVSSSDGGVTWTVIPAQPPGGNVLALANGGTTIYALTETGIQTTIDQGYSWMPLPKMPSGIPLNLTVSIAQPDIIYVASNKGLMKTINFGESWEEIGPPISIAAVSVSSKLPSRILVVSSDGVVYRSDDAGVSWR